MSSSTARSAGPAVTLGYRPALDGIRAIAIACVVSSHTIGFPATGFLGVEIFFVLSGFLITTLLLEEHARRGSVSLRNFYRRRALRLLPALVVLLGVFLVGSLVGAAAGLTQLDRALFGVVAGLGYFTNIVVASGTAGQTALPNELGHLWSLAIEEQFYLVWPVVLLLLFRARPRLALVGLGMLVVLVAAQQIRLYLNGASWERIAYGSDTRSTSILMGCALAVALFTRAQRPIERTAGGLAPLGVASFLVLLLVVPESSTLSIWLLAVALSSAWLVVVSLRSHTLLARALSVPPLVFLGRISYALYLWHVPVYVALGLSTAPELGDAPALVLSLACATASYYVVERRFLRRKESGRTAWEPARALTLETHRLQTGGLVVEAEGAGAKSLA